MNSVSSQIESMKERIWERVVSGQASDVEQILFKNLEMNQQHYQERKDENRIILEKLEHLERLLTPDDSDQSGIVTWRQIHSQGGFISWNQVKGGWGIMWASVSAIPLLVSLWVLFFAK